MVKKNKDWWVAQAHMYGREVGLLRDRLEKEALECADYKHHLKRKIEMLEATTAKMTRCAEMLEAVVNALAVHEGHDELLADARFYLNILTHDKKVLERPVDYFDWARQQRGK